MMLMIIIIMLALVLWHFYFNIWYNVTVSKNCMHSSCSWKQIYCRPCLKCDGTRTETRFLLSAKRTSPFKSAGASVQSTTGSRGVRISGSNAGYTRFRGRVKGTGYPLHSTSFPFTSPPVRHRVPSHFSWSLPAACSETVRSFYACIRTYFLEVLRNSNNICEEVMPTPFRYFPYPPFRTAEKQTILFHSVYWFVRPFHCIRFVTWDKAEG